MINFYINRVSYKLPYGFKKECRSVLYTIAESENRKINSLNIIITSDKELLSLNNQYLQHDYFTDIITFDYTESNCLKGEMYISIERIMENAKTYNQTVELELQRIIIHGLLHLCRYSDKTENEKKLMTEKENYYLKK